MKDEENAMRKNLRRKILIRGTMLTEYRNEYKLSSEV
jgi:hypothetical protein